MKKFTVSIVTVSMNRTCHLRHSVKAAAKMREHIEHIVLDYGSTEEVKRSDLPLDTRIKLCRARNDTGRWWLTHSYNLAFALASGDFILKLDADIILEENYLDLLLKTIAETRAHMLCNRLTLQDWGLPNNSFTTNGLFICKRKSLEEIRGFNPYIQGWGWDEIDLYGRFFLAGYPVSRLPSQGVRVIEHDDEIRDKAERDSRINAHGWRLSRHLDVSAERRLIAQNEKNKAIAINCITANITWPELQTYRSYFAKSGALVDLPRVSVINEKTKSTLIKQLRWLLLRPSRLQQYVWTVMGWFNCGPYSRKNTNLLLERCNISLSLVS